MEKVPGDIIYILVMLAIFIFSALKKKKRVSEDEIPVPEREGKSPMDEVFSPFKDIFDDEEEEKKKETAATTPSPENRKENLRGSPFVKEDYVFTSNTSPGDARRQRRNRTPGRQPFLKSGETESIEGEEEAYSEEEEWFDLRKAVVFSEILKRPDY
jgi:hypothetical protein